MRCRSTYLVFHTLFATALGACAITGCSTDHADEAKDDLGSLGLRVQIGDDVELHTMDYVITGNGFTTSGTLDVAHSDTVRAFIGGIPAGLGFTLTLQATDLNNPTLTCSGFATFDVVAGATTTTSVTLQCRLPGGTGSLLIDGTLNVCPRIDALSAAPLEVQVGHSIALSTAITDVDAKPSAATVTWTSTSGTLRDNHALATSLTCSEVGTVRVNLVADDTDCSDHVEVQVACVPADGSETPVVVRINEIESSGGTPGDWVELYNAGEAAADLSGWIFKDSDDSHAYTLPAGTTLPVGAYLVLEEGSFGFGLGAADAARLFDRTGTLMVDHYTWGSHAPTTYGRCPNGNGAPTATKWSTKGAVNSCPGDIRRDPWPGNNAVQTVDVANTFGANMSGLTYQPATADAPAVLWAAQNNPSKIYRLLASGSQWLPDTADGWQTGKILHYPDGTGAPDTEGVTKTSWDDPALYIAAERNNQNSSVSRLSILRYDSRASFAELTATHEWNLTADLPAAGANLGLEAITWIPDTFLVAQHFADVQSGTAYDPALYPNHGEGLFFVGVEGTGMIHAYALNHGDTSFTRIASFSGGQPGVMGLEFDRDTGYLWATCDNTCGNTTAILTVISDPSSPDYGRFGVDRFLAKPSTLLDINNEGIAIAPASECVAGQRWYFWSDDDQSEGHAVRRDTVPCGTF